MITFGFPYIKLCQAHSFLFFLCFTCSPSFTQLLFSSLFPALSLDVHLSTLSHPDRCYQFMPWPEKPLRVKKKRKEKRHRGEGITERPQSGNDMGDKTADHSTLQRLVFTWCQLSLPALCSPPCSIDLHSPFYSALFASFPKRATDET